MAYQSMSLTQQMKQQMVLAPQLRQSLELLQVPLLELRTLLRKELEQNPVLEERPLEMLTIEVEEKAGEVDDSKELDFEEEFETLSRLDDEWRDYFMQHSENEPYDASRQKKRDFLFESIVQNISLQDHLLGQLSVSGLDDEHKRLGELLIGSINDDGYLEQDIDTLALSTGTDPATLRDVLATIREMDPVGVGAQNLKECLLLQLERVGHQDPIAVDVIKNHIQQLGQKKYKEIAQALGVSPERIHEVSVLIATLE
ncbi:MAG: hypothetical protein GX811_05805, partial [Lentisphaerae bacterium]|nr:hypothetical protein [Lentisphaerota bacterium]